MRAGKPANPLNWHATIVIRYLCNLQRHPRAGEDTHLTSTQELVKIHNMCKDIIISYKLTTCPYIKYRIPRIVPTILHLFTLAIGYSFKLAMFYNISLLSSLRVSEWLLLSWFGALDSKFFLQYILKINLMNLYSLKFNQIQHSSIKITFVILTH